MIFSVGILPSLSYMGLSILSPSLASAVALARPPWMRSSPSAGGSSTEQALISAVAKSAILARFPGGLASVVASPLPEEEEGRWTEEGSPALSDDSDDGFADMAGDGIVFAVDVSVVEGILRLRD